MPRATAFYKSASYGQVPSVAYLMKRVVGSVVQQADRRLAPLQLTQAQWGPMFWLKLHGRSTVAELARATQVDAGAMTRLLDRLERKQLLRRLRSTTDRRVVQVELTIAGLAAVQPVPTVLSEVMNAHLAGFTRAEFELLTSLLQRMQANGDALRGAEDPDA